MTYGGCTDPEIAICDGTAVPSCLNGFSIGDPHIQRISGETFELLRSGSNAMVRIPADASDGEASLLVQTFSERLQNCPDIPSMWTRNISVSGKWLEDRGMTSPICFEHEDVFGPDNFNTFNAIRVSYQNTWMSMEQLKTILPQGVLQILPRRHEQPREPLLMLSRSTPMAVNLHFGHLQIGIDYVSSLTRKGRRNHLDLRLLNCRSIPETIGGLLGSDDYTEAAHLPPECGERLQNGRLWPIDPERYGDEWVKKRQAAKEKLKEDLYASLEE